MVKKRSNQWTVRIFHILFPIPQVLPFSSDESSVSLKIYFSLVHLVCNFMLASNSIKFEIVSSDHIVPKTCLNSPLESSLPQ